jgi:hypothetical protein
MGCAVTIKKFKKLLVDLSITIKASQYPQSISSKFNRKKNLQQCYGFEARNIFLVNIDEQTTLTDLSK